MGSGNCSGGTRQTPHASSRRTVVARQHRGGEPDGKGLAHVAHQLLETFSGRCESHDSHSNIRIVLVRSTPCRKEHKPKLRNGRTCATADLLQCLSEFLAPYSIVQSDLILDLDSRRSPPRLQRIWALRR